MRFRTQKNYVINFCLFASPGIFTLCVAMAKIGEDVKQINGSVFGNIAKIEDRLGKFDSVANDLVNKCNAANKRSDGLAKEVEAARLKTEARIDLKASTADLEKTVSQGRFTLLF